MKIVKNLLWSKFITLMFAKWGTHIKIIDVDVKMSRY